MCLLSRCRSDATIGKTLPLAGPKAWTNDEVIALCEKLGNMDAEVRNVPVWILKATRGILRSLQWANDAADRLVSASCGLPGDLSAWTGGLVAGWFIRMVMPG